MAAAGEKAKSTIVIKKIKKGGHGHHGGAWKIAYADFVTAMMAFFLLMWLLGSTTKGDLRGIADYFQSPLQVAMAGGSGSGDATSMIPGGGQDLTFSVGQIKRGEPLKDTKRMRAALAEQEREKENKRMEEIDRKIEEALMANPKLAEYKDQVKIDITPEGLRVQILDDFQRPMFDMGGANVKSYMRDILQQIGEVLNDVDNRILLSGHTDSAPYVGGERGYSNWELSTERANASRRELIAGGMDPSKVMRVVGMADAMPMVADDPRSPLNRRIAIVVLNRFAQERLEHPEGELAAHSAADVDKALGGAGADDGDAQPQADGGAAGKPQVEGAQVEGAPAAKAQAAEAQPQADAPRAATRTTAKSAAKSR